MRFRYDKMKSGFTLIEMVVVLGIIAVLGGTITPLAFQVISARREQATREELKTIKRAIIGDAKRTNYGEEFTFGFAGDLGNVPATLSELKVPGTLPLFSFDTARNMGSGWRGPYMMEQFGDFGKDPYGNDYVYSNTPYTNTDLGVEVLAKITGIGPDEALGTADDLSIEILEPDVRSDIVGLAKDSSNLGIRSIGVDIYYPSNGVLTLTSTQTDTNGVFQLTDIPMGDRTIFLQPSLLYKANSAFTTGNSQNDLEFVITNYSQNTISISSLNATYTSDPPAYYSEVLVDDSSVFTVTGQDPRPGSGTLITFSGTPPSMAPSPIAGNVNIRRIQMPRIEAPDVKLSALNAGGSLTIKLQDFVDAQTGGGQSVVMTGVLFTMTLSDGSILDMVPRKQ